MKNKAGKIRSLLGWTAKVLVPLTLLGLLFIRFRPGPIFAEMKKLSLPLFSLVVLAHFLILAIKAIRWRRLLASFGIESSYGEALRAYIAGSSFGTVTPGQLGDMAKVMFLTNAQGQRFLALIPSFADRLWDLAGLALVSGACGVFLFHERITSEFWMCFFLGLVIMVIFSPFFYRFGQKMLLKKMNVDIAVLKKSCLLAFLVTAVSLTVQFSRWGLLAAAMDLPLFPTAPCAMIGTFAALIPVSFGGLGTREAVIAALFVMKGLDPAAGVTFSLLMFGTYLIGAAGGLLLLPSLHIDIRKWKSNGRE